MKDARAGALLADEEGARLSFLNSKEQSVLEVGTRNLHGGKVQVPYIELRNQEREIVFGLYAHPNGTFQRTRQNTTDLDTGEETGLPEELRR